MSVIDNGIDVEEKLIAMVTGVDVEEKLIEMVAGGDGRDVTAYIIAHELSRKALETVVYQVIYHNKLNILYNLFQAGKIPWVVEWCQANHQQHVVDFLMTHRA